jgi:hypothetical protein
MKDEYTGAKMFGYENKPEQPRDENQPKPERPQKPLPTQELLVWIRRRNRPAISLRDIQVYGPRASRERKTAISHLEALERHGWLAPMKPHRRDRRLWQTPPAGATALDQD